jgi:hypothetical protein
VGNNKPNLTTLEMEEIDKLKDKYIEVFNDSVKKGEDPWKTTDELAGATGSTVNVVLTIIKNSDDFVKNSKGKIVTKKIYEKKTPFWEKFLDTYTGKIK